MIKKKVRRVKYIKPSDELPSFLASIRRKTKEIKLPAKKDEIGFKGPIFFGGCTQYHPNPHPIIAPSLSILSYRARVRSTENIWQNLFQDVPSFAKEYPPRKPFRLVKRKPLFPEEVVHRARGKRVVAGHEAVPFTPDFAKRRPWIRGETIREILCSIPVEETFRWEDIPFEQERKRNLLEVDRGILPPNQRAAHYHFPKEFITVKVMGPLIPGSLYVTPLPYEEEPVKTRNRAVQVHEESLLTEIELDMGYREEQQEQEEFWGSFWGSEEEYGAEHAGEEEDWQCRDFDYYESDN